RATKPPRRRVRRQLVAFRVGNFAYPYSVLGFQSSKVPPCAADRARLGPVTPLLTSRENKELRALRSRKGRARAGRFLAEGIRVVEDLLGSDLTPRWVVCTSSLEDTERGLRLREEIDRSGLVRRELAEPA